ncbi:MAG: cupin protein [Steroidobacteraceae bacterium]|nr:cupin protein [Steroidobacteraceae bacterium]
MANDVSTRLKAVRLMHGLSQRELAKRAGVTNGMISLIEQGRVSPSVASLKKVLDGLPMQLAEFFTMDPAATAPGADTGSEMLSHAGEEGGVVVSGRIEVTVGGQTQVLGPGDAYYFSSAVPHRFRNRGRERCEIISAATPPTL